MATFTRLRSGSWRAQIRRKGKYVNETFLRRGPIPDSAAQLIDDRSENESGGASPAKQRGVTKLGRAHEMS
jgi:hypothetical protein